MQNSKAGVRGQELESGKQNKTVHRSLFTVWLLLFTIHFSLFTDNAFAEDLQLQPLIDEALKNNHEILMTESKVSASRFRIPQAKSLPDPMFMFGYQNEGWSKYTYGEMEGAQWMFSASQMFPFPGKLQLKGEMAVWESEGLKDIHSSVRLRTIAKIKELYYDLFFIYKNIDLIKDKMSLFTKIEDAALARYSAGMGNQMEILMAQTEKYMILEKEEMIKQKKQSIEAMLNSTIGRDVNTPLGRPVEPLHTANPFNMDNLIKTAYENSPEIKSKEKMIAAAEAKVLMAKKEYYPDFTVTGSVFKRKGDFDDMWSLTTAINIPIFYKTKQKQAVLEAEALLSESRHDLEAVKIMLSSAIRDNHSMAVSAERLMDLYKNGLIPKTYQDFDAALAGYASGKTEAITVITRLKSLIDYEILYWNQFVERGKAIARIEALTGIK